MKDKHLLYAAAFLRSFSVGITGVLLGLYLTQLGFTAVRVGFILALGLAGAAAGTLAVALYAERVGRRRMLFILSFLTFAGGVAVAAGGDFLILAAGAFFGMANGMGRDRGACAALEQSMLPSTVRDDQRTEIFARYTFLMDAASVLGALAAGLPSILRGAGVADVASYRAVIALHAVSGFASFLIYRKLSPAVEARAAGTEGVRISATSRRTIAKLSALFALDSLGGGFLTGALVSFWFFKQFGASEAALGLLFAAARAANGVSYFGAAWLARRIGLVNTMVFTHLPSNLLLMALPFAPSFPFAVVLFLARELLVEMDVPTRRSYVVAVVAPEARTAAAGSANFTRVAGWALAPSLAGWLMQNMALSAPFFWGAGIKIVYDVLLFSLFRRVKPPEEMGPRS